MPLEPPVIAMDFGSGQGQAHARRGIGPGKRGADAAGAAGDRYGFWILHGGAPLENLMGTARLLTGGRAYIKAATRPLVNEAPLWPFRIPSPA
jgi:hypothetical protein